MPKIKAFIKLETKENAKKCIPLVSIYIKNEKEPEENPVLFHVIKCSVRLCESNHSGNPIAAGLKLYPANASVRELDQAFFVEMAYSTFESIFTHMSLTFDNIRGSFVIKRKHSAVFIDDP